GNRTGPWRCAGCRSCGWIHAWGAPQVWTHAPDPAGIAAAAPPDRRPAPSPPHGLPPLLAGGWEGHLPEPTSHHLPPPQPSPARAGGSRGWRGWGPVRGPGGAEPAPVGGGAGSGAKG